VERLLNRKKRKLQNSRVSKEKSHNFFVTLSHIIAQNVQFLNHNSGGVGWAMLEAFMMQREQGRRREQAYV
jgi:hypothetical protein